MTTSHSSNHTALLHSFFESVEDGIHISDSEGNIIYANETSRKRLGITPDDTAHVRDFEPLFQSKEAWIAHVEELRVSGRIVIRSINKNKKIGKSTPVEVTVFIKHVLGKEYIFASSKEITTLLEQENKLAIRETMLNAISESTTELLYNKNFFVAISNVLEIIGKAVQADRTYLFTANLDDEGLEVVSQRSEWNSGDAEPQIDNPALQNIPTNLYGDIMPFLNENKAFQSIVAALPDSSPLKEILASQGIISILIIPVFHNAKLWGFIGYDACKQERLWDNVEVTILQTLANNITAALAKLDDNQQIETLAEFPLENPAPVLRINKTGQLLFQNKIELLETDAFQRLGENELLSFEQLLQLIASDFVNGEKINYYEVRSFNGKYYSITAKEISNKLHINLYFNEISKLKQTERELRNSRSVVEQIVSNLEDVIWSVTYPEFTPLFISPSAEKIYGFPASEFYKNSQIWMDSIVEEDKHIVDHIFENLNHSGESDCEYRIQLPSGEIKWLRNKTKLMMDVETELPIRYDGYIIDITDQKKVQSLSEEAIRLSQEANLAKEEFIANMSHEIRTPLNAILGLSRHLENRFEDEENRATLQNIIQSGKHLQSLIENVLDFSKIEAGQFELNPLKVNLQSELISVYTMLESSAKEKNIAMEKLLYGDLDVLVEIDSRRLRQILINIISNSIKFTDVGSVTLHAVAIPNHNKFEVTIKDTGIGMSKKFIERIYDKFAQEDSSPERKEQGTGLGMAITKKLIDLMGGSIEIKSAEGVGTTIRVILPFSPVTAQKNSKNNELRNVHIEEKEILVVEDNDLNVFVVCKLLSKYGVKTSVAKNGVQAIEALKQRSFDVILMDLQMPLMGGLAATQIIRLELKLTTPIIGLSANALEEKKSECLAAGMNGYISKPFEEDTLIETISQNLFVEPIPQKAYNLTKYFSGEEKNTAYLDEIITMFTERIPAYIAEMKVAFEGQSYDLIKRIAHKVKPNLFMFGVVTCSESIDFLNEFNENDENDVSKLEETINFLDVRMQQVCIELKKDHANSCLFD